MFKKGDPVQFIDPDFTYNPELYLTFGTVVKICDDKSFGDVHWITEAGCEWYSSSKQLQPSHEGVNKKLIKSWIGVE